MPRAKQLRPTFKGDAGGLEDRVKPYPLPDESTQRLLAPHIFALGYHGILYPRRYNFSYRALNPADHAGAYLDACRLMLEATPDTSRVHILARDCQDWMEKEEEIRLKGKLGDGPWFFPLAESRVKSRLEMTH